MSRHWETLAALPLQVESYELTGHDREFGDFTRPSTVVHLHGGGQEGIGEDVVYDVLDHIAHRDAGPVLDLTSRRPSASPATCSASSTSSRSLRPSVTRRGSTAAGRMSAPRSTWRCARTASRSGRSLGAIRSRCASSARRGSRPSTATTSSSTEPIRKRLAKYPVLEFKLDPENDWTPR